jgi:hypothetical protein
MWSLKSLPQVGGAAWRIFLHQARCRAGAHFGVLYNGDTCTGIGSWFPERIMSLWASCWCAAAGFLGLCYQGLPAGLTPHGALVECGLWTCAWEATLGALSN